MNESYRSKRGQAIIKELHALGVSYENIASFLSESGYTSFRGEGEITAETIRGFCRRAGLKRQPGWNLKHATKKPHHVIFFLKKLSLIAAGTLALSYLYAWLVMR